MASLNKVQLIGNLGKDPEARFQANGTAISNITVATARQWKDKETGEKREETDWHRVVFYGRLAEVVNEYLKKGSAIYVEGRLKTRQWQDKDGADHWTTEVIATEMQMLDSRKRESSDEPSAKSENGSGKKGRKKAGTKKVPATASAGFDDADDDSPPF